MIECLNTRTGRLERNEEHEFSEDSDYESETELQDASVTGNTEADHGENRGQKLLPVLKVGSLAA